MLIQRWEKFIPQQFVAVGKDERCVTFQCTNAEATAIIAFINNEMGQGKVWVVSCTTSGGNKTGGWLAAATDVITYSLSFELAEDYHAFLAKFDG